jgi:hypothetical protein
MTLRRLNLAKYIRCLEGPLSIHLTLSLCFYTRSGSWQEIERSRPDRKCRKKSSYKPTDRCTGQPFTQSATPRLLNTKYATQCAQLLALNPRRPSMHGACRIQSSFWSGRERRQAWSTRYYATLFMSDTGRALRGRRTLACELNTGRGYIPRLIVADFETILNLKRTYGRILGRSLMLRSSS